MEKKTKIIVSGIGIIALIIGIFMIYVYLQGATVLDHLDYSDYEQGFGFNPPEGWVVYEYETYQSGVIFYDPSIGLSVQMAITGPFILDAGETLEDFNEEALNSIIENISNIQNFSLLSSEKTIINGMDAIETVFRYFNPSTNSTNFFKHVGVEKDKKIFEIGFEAPENQYNELISIFDQSVNTFTII